MAARVRQKLKLPPIAGVLLCILLDLDDEQVVGTTLALAVMHNNVR
jgi:hypothetical protein